MVSGFSGHLLCKGIFFFFNFWSLFIRIGSAIEQIIFFSCIPESLVQESNSWEKVYIIIVQKYNRLKTEILMKIEQKKKLDSFTIKL